MAHVKDVVNYLVYLRDEDEKNGEYYSLSNLKLQKLLYYCQGGHYRWDGEALIEDADFEAWRYGPVIPDVYFQFSKYGQNDIPNDIGEFDLSNDEAETIEAVWNQLKSLHAYSLVDSTHKEDPWVDNYKEGYNNIIDDADIQEYFTKD
ncbi:Panacea domain-containing protein [Lysinibacillus capsici]|uniref:Panacea domain-containing protein n=1 Tax=Lysinibacillus capsici TaxID=2115968 RepID=UPI0028A12E56|nr:type II toxin-antitoxin system antitoxin SocA domain-containing protein [Lysinibacillus capsici]